MASTVRTACLLVALALGGAVGTWTLAPFLTAPWHLTGDAPVTAVVSACAWLLLACLGWLALGVLVTLRDLRGPARTSRSRLLAPAALRRVVVVLVGVGLSGSVAGVASAAQPGPAGPAPATPPSSAAAPRLDGLVLPDRVEDVAPAPRTPAPRTPAPAPHPTPDPTPGPMPDPVPDPVPASTPGPAPSPDPAHPLVSAPGPTGRTGPRSAPGSSADPGQEPRRTPAAAGRTVVVRPGDSLWSIAARTLPEGSGPAQVDSAWRRIYAANRPPLGPDPDLIRPGDVLGIPRDLAAARPDHPSDHQEPR